MQPDVTHLPKTAQILVALIGLPCTLVLVDKLGGKDVRLHKGGDSVARFAAHIGQDAADKIFQYFGSDQFTVPKCERALKAVRNARIHADYDRMTRAERKSDCEAVHSLVDAFCLSERHIRRLLKKSSVPSPRVPRAAAVDSRQMSLL